MRPDDDITNVVAMVFMLRCSVYVQSLSHLVMVEQYSTNYFCAYIAIATGYTLEEISKHWTYLEETLVPTLRECVCLSVCSSLHICMYSTFCIVQLL